MSYISPINSRYKAPILSKLWCSDSKIIKMRQLWIDLALFQKQLGIKSITSEGIEEMTLNISKIDYDKINEYETKFKHDIMAHIYAFGNLCPKAKSFIHLGATSNFINDNVDMIIVKESLTLIDELLFKLFQILKEKSLKYKDLSTLAYTHLQPAQLTTVGKRFTIWNSDIYIDLTNLDDIIKKLPFRGIKGTVGTEDTILKLFNGDHNKCDLLNEKLCDKYSFENNLKICGQTYSRKYDVLVFQILSSICQTIYKIMNDIRLLSSKMEVYEFFDKEQIGSSAMPYKMNPITCEKICSLCRYIINQENCMSQTYLNQWLERTLDDSAIKRIIYPECFLLLEHILNESIKCISSLVINENKITNNVLSNMPYILSEQIILNGVELGYSRQEIHEKLRVILTKVKRDTSQIISNDNTLEIILVIFENDAIISRIIKEKQISINPQDYIGRAIQQTELFYNDKYKSLELSDL
jgi:adenylosuccinate lyase